MLKNKYLQDKRKHQTEFEKQIKLQDCAKNEVRFETIDEEDEEVSDFTESYNKISNESFA